MRRRADIVFGPAKVAVFVDGCFWHSCPQHGTKPKANNEWWADKLARNMARDRDTDQALSAAGWISVRIWEHEDMNSSALTIRDVIKDRLQPRHVDDQPP